MAITSSDLEYRLSGGTSNTTASAALGGAMSTAGGGVITTAVLNNLFDDVSGDEASAGDTEYRGIYIKNNHGTLTWSAVKAWISTVDPHAGATFAIALAGEGASAAMETIANESTAPSGETFSSPTTKGTGLTIPDLAAGAYLGIWVRRVIGAATAATASTGPTLRVEGDTPA
jgi:hypothetical protein